MDGYAVAREIRRREPGPGPTLVAVTGYGAERDRTRTREAGFSEHLVKPARFEAIQRLLANTPARDAPAVLP
jgi:CheY-like chemotaxis protein